MRFSPVLLLSAVLASGMLVLAVPRTVSSFIIVPSEETLRKLQGRSGVGEDELTMLIDRERNALAWLDSGRGWTDLGLAQLLMAEPYERNSSTAKSILDQAVASLRSGLELAPGNPYAWARLSYAEALRNGWTPLAVSALRMAILTAPYEPRLMWSRLRLAMLAWARMSPEDRELVMQQIRYAWHDDQQQLVQMAVELKQTATVRVALKRVPDAVAKFDSLSATVSPSPDN